MIEKPVSDHGFDKISRSIYKKKDEHPSLVSSVLPTGEPKDLIDFSQTAPVDIDPFEPNNDIRKTAYTPPPPEKEWTVLIYMAGDNELEPYLVSNLKSLEKIGSTPRINILVELDRGEFPVSPISKWNGSRRLYVQKSNDPARITSSVVSNLGNVNMADPQHLADFIKWGMKNYPAKHYLLIINDHGYGFMGIADDKGNKDTMTLPELGKALEMATKGDDGVEKTAGRKIDILGFDACLMGQAEVAYQLKDYADIMIASQEVIGSGGWPYNAIYDEKTGKMVSVTKGGMTSALSDDLIGYLGARFYPQNAALSQFLQNAETIIDDNGQLEPEVFAKAIISYCEKNTQTTPTMAAIRMGEPVSHLAEKVKELGIAIKNCPQKDVLLDIIKYTQRFNKQAPAQNPYGDYRDLYDFCYNLAHSRKLEDAALKSIAEEVQKAVDRVIIKRISDNALPSKYKNASGISLYVPDSLGETDYGYGEIAFEKDTHWLENTRDLAKYDPKEKWDPLFRPPEIRSKKRSEKEETK